ncbi:MAG TPA: ABC transporter ATP-binding protein [Isosphaeraceae bacterium]|jgi:ATP-binding cassette subfamily B protein
MGLPHTISWPACRLGEAIEALGLRGGLGPRPAELDAPPADGALEVWIEAAAAWLGLEAEPVEVPYAEADRLVRGAGPALLRVADGRESRFLVLLRGDRRRPALLTPDGAVVRVPAERVRASLCREVEAGREGEVERLLDAVGLRGGRRIRARRALLCELIGPKRVGGGWLLRPSGGSGPGIPAREAGLPRLLAGLLAAHAGQYGLWLLSWWVLGWMALTGHFDTGWLVAWQLLLLTLVPLRLLTTWLGGRLAIGAGGLLKRRLLVGALKLEPDEIRHLGVGQLLGRVLESEVVEATAIAGGFLALTAAVELVLAGFVLGAGAGGLLHVALLLGTVLAAGGLGAGYVGRRRRWTEGRLDLTGGLVEAMVGHRTRLAQQRRGRWDEGEDRDLERYLGASTALDDAGVRLQALVPRGWLVVGLLGLVPAFVAGGRSSAGLAVGIGGVLLAYGALRNLVAGLDQVAATAIAWGRIGPFWRAAARPEPIGPPGWAVRPPVADPGRTVIEARGLRFGYPGRGEPVLKEVDVRIGAGDRLLLEGSSGGGKSTLAAVLAGGRVPEAGLLLLGGLDLRTLGAAAWRRRVVVAPQFHENRVVMGTLAFNLLMGRAWPPRPADLDEAERVCRALGLGPLLDRMPAGLAQVVGETGWQLSHGEASRLYLARALLERAELVLLDESFAALDPATLRQALGFVRDEAPTVLVVAHP